jgi:ribonuclease HI
MIQGLNVPVKATPQDLMPRISRALKAEELDQRFVVITPEDWRHAKAIRVEFTFERPELETLREATEKFFRDDFNPMLPVFIETDGACAGNDDKKSPGGWGAIIVQGYRMMKRCGSKPDTSNNEMEYTAMLEALQFVQNGAYVIMETDSQGCIDGITKYRLRWEKHGWRKDDGMPVENAELIKLVCMKVDKMHVGFWKVAGHSNDPWNDQADALAVHGRNQEATNVTISLIFRPVINGKEGFEAFARFSVSSHANIYDFWPRLIDKCGAGIGNPEDYEIWAERHKLSGRLVMGLSYEIVSKYSPGCPRIPKKRRTSMADLPPRPASRDMLPPAQAFANPPPESVSKWGEEMEVRFEDVSGTQGSTPIGYVYATKEGER